ncbi:MAG: DNA-3-methyladenine glycosylase 2 family protein, partial [Pseudomonadota bacterium]|nr:DNA-3-methyladenine glycosylase 2 family protein [Pseudomonadota bacterium]MEC9284984.1 DNA-3-methyladenine glycosylase 2 family protein [Pseudomonadota bacterium]
VRRALDVVGYPEARRRPEGFETFLRIIVGQQVSVAAANAIYGRLIGALGTDVSESRLLRLRESTLRKAGLSKAKCTYVRALARIIRDGELDVAALRELSDEEALVQIQTVPGLGRWSAEIYLMFSLGRPDLWPRGDVGAMRGLQKIMELEARPTIAEADELARRYSPYRTAMALLAWRCANATAL